MLTNEEIQIVRQATLFAGLSDADLECIRMGEIVEYPAGAVMASDGDPGEYFYLMLSGEVRIWKHYDRQDILMAVGKPGHFMGEIGILIGHSLAGDGARLAAVPLLSTRQERLLENDEHLSVDCQRNPSDCGGTVPKPGGFCASAGKTDFSGDNGRRPGA